MNLNEFKQKVHANAVDHGWWDEEYTDAVAIALIHAEISEALESWRNNEPPVWYRCNMEPDKSQSCGGENCGYACMSASGSHWDAEERNCAAGKRKPEGAAVELIDVVLRVLDTAGAWGIGILQDKSLYTVTDAAGNSHVIAELTLPELVRYLHQLTTSLSFYREKKEFDGTMVKMSELILLIFTWLEAHDIDPVALMMEKHRYNKQRQYKHGGKRV